MSENVENKREKVKKIGAIVLSAVLVSGIGYGTYNNFISPSPENEVITVDGGEDEPITIIKQEDGDFDFIVKDNRKTEKQERDFSHLDEVVIQEAKEKLANRGRDLEHLELVALQHAEEMNKGQEFKRDDDGQLVFEDPKKDSTLGDLLVMNDSKDDDIVITLPAENEPEVEKPLEPVTPEPTPEPEPVTPEPEPEKPITPIDPGEPDQPINPVDPEKPVEPEKPTEPLVDKTELDNVVNKANEINRIVYTKDSLKVLDDAVANAKNVKTQAEVNKAIADIQQALDNLKTQEQAEYEEVIKDYNHALSIVKEKLASSNYTGGSVDAGKIDVYDIEQLFKEGKEEKSVGAIKELTDLLKEVENALVDISGLKTTLAEAKSLELENKTNESIVALEVAIVQAEQVLRNPHAKDMEIEEALILLQQAMDGLTDIEEKDEPEEEAQENTNDEEDDSVEVIGEEDSSGNLEENIDTEVVDEEDTETEVEGDGSNKTDEGEETESETEQEEQSEGNSAEVLIQDDGSDN